MPAAASYTINTGDIAPKFTTSFVASGGAGTASLPAEPAGPVILYFYPRDNTPGCTVEALDFTALRSEFSALNAQIYGVSADSAKKHENFIGKHSLGIPLLNDPDAEICKAYDVWHEKSMYGKTFWGIERSTFLISQDGKVLQCWRKVKVPNHAQEVLDCLKEALGA
jgi:peroxiredoxin Q/BCP